MKSSTKARRRGKTVDAAIERNGHFSLKAEEAITHILGAKEGNQ